MTPDKTRDGLRGLTTRLLALCLAMVVAGLVLPSPQVGAASPRPRPARVSPYHPLRHPAPPADLIVPSLHIRAQVVPIDVVDHVLTPPSDYRMVGWWRGSAEPGAQHGQTVLTGHTVHTGGGAMDRLGQIGMGALVQVRNARGVLMNYAATRVVVYTKDQLAQHAQELFRQDRPDHRLVLITCTGWTGSYYTSNVIVFGRPLGVLKKKTPPAAS